MIYKKIIQELENLSDPKRAVASRRFFKTGPGEYGEGDIFIGVRVPDIRKVVTLFLGEATLDDVQELLDSKIHEERLAGVLVLVKKYQKSGDEVSRKKIFDFYLKNSKRINNWDLVDVSAHEIVGDFLWKAEGGQNFELLRKLARSRDMWERRIGIVSTWKFIREGSYDATFEISKMLLGDQEDLLHKATGWMLREAGKRDKKMLVNFLEENISVMPRVCLRYAIEKFDEQERKYFLNK